MYHANLNFSSQGNFLFHLILAIQIELGKYPFFRKGFQPFESPRGGVRRCLHLNRNVTANSEVNFKLCYSSALKLNFTLAGTETTLLLARIAGFVDTSLKKHNIPFFRA